jgi:toxin ParE1/3/4
MKRYRLTRDADGDLDSIEAWISAENPTAAERVLEALFSTMQLLAQQPRIGRLRSDLRADLRVFPGKRPAHHYVIFYEPSDDGVLVLRVLHGARDWPTLIQQQPS